MDKERWNFINRITLEAQEYFGEARKVFIQKACAEAYPTDISLPNEVEELMAKMDQPTPSVLVEVEADDLPEGLILGGRYKVGKRIGVGGMGKVYQASDSELGRQVALKIVKTIDIQAINDTKEKVKEEAKSLAKVINDTKERFKEEAKSLAKVTEDLNAPLIVDIFDYGVTEQGIPYMVMNYLTGDNLQEKLNEVKEESFEITEWCLDELKDKVTEDVIEKLKSLMDQEFKTESDFLAFIAKYLSAKEIVKFQILILKHAKLVINKRFPPKEALEILKPIIEAVSKAHGKGIIHRDLKPSNIVLSTTEQKTIAVLIDFGIATNIHRYLSKQSTNGRASFQTTDYASPEQGEGRELGLTSDIYSLGVIFYKLVSGKLPSRKKGSARLHTLSLTHDVPLAFSYAIAKALSIDPKNRQANCQEFLDELNKAFDVVVVVSDEMLLSKMAVIGNKILISVPLLAGVIGGIVRLLLSWGFGSFLYTTKITSMSSWIPFLQGFWGTLIGAFLIALVLKSAPEKEVTINLLQVLQLTAAGLACGLLVFFSISNFIPPFTLIELGWEKYKYGCIVTCTSWGAGLALGSYLTNKQVAKASNYLEVLRKQLWGAGIGAILSVVLASPILVMYYSIANSATVENLWPRTISDVFVQTISVCGVLAVFYWQNKRYTNTFTAS